MDKIINYGFKRNGLVNGVPTPNIDGKYGIYASLEEACAQIPIEERAIGLTVGIEDVNHSISEYWWKRGIGDNDLESKNDFDSIQDQIDELNYKVDHIVPVGPGGIEIVVGSTLSYDPDTKYLNVANPLPDTIYLSGSIVHIDSFVQIDKYKTFKIGSIITFNENSISGSTINLIGSTINISGSIVNLSGSSILLNGNDNNGSIYISTINNRESILLDRYNSEIRIKSDNIILSGETTLNGDTTLSGNITLSGDINLSGSILLNNGPLYNTNLSPSGSLYIGGSETTDIKLTGKDITINSDNCKFYSSGTGSNGTISLECNRFILTGDMSIHNDVKIGLVGSKASIHRYDNNITIRHGIAGSISLLGTNINIGGSGSSSANGKNINLYGNTNLGGFLSSGQTGSITLGFTGDGVGDIYINDGSNVYKFISGSFVLQ